MHPTENPDPFGGTPENWSRAEDPADRDDVSDPWPPIDPADLAALNRWMDEQEAMASL